MKDLAKRQELHKQIVKLYQIIQPVLTEAGISQERYNVRPFDASRYTVKRLEDILNQLQSFVEGEEVLIFKTASNLQPPGCLLRWSSNELMSQAREVLVYKSAAQLLRHRWHNSGSVKSFFTMKKESDETV